MYFDDQTLLDGLWPVYRFLSIEKLYVYTYICANLFVFRVCVCYVYRVRLSLTIVCIPEAVADYCTGETNEWMNLIDEDC